MFQNFENQIQKRKKIPKIHVGFKKPWIYLIHSLSDYLSDNIFFWQFLDIFEIIIMQSKCPWYL